jgi:hypothetical protein
MGLICEARIRFSDCGIRFSNCRIRFNKSLIIPHEDSAILRASLRGETLWTYQTRYAQAFKKVNDRDGTKVVCLDLEFSSTSRLVFEVGMCDYYSGKDLINARIKHDPRWLMTSIPASTGKSLASGGR